MDNIIKASTDAARHDPDTEHLPSMSHVRAYGYSPGHMNLQIRSEGKISDHGSKQWWVISNARLDVETAVALHTALQEWIEEQPRGEALLAKKAA